MDYTAQLQAGNDGLAHAEKIVTEAGGTITPGGVIALPSGCYYSDELIEAIKWLTREWDYELTSPLP